jgi:hypothetical protein
VTPSVLRLLREVRRLRAAYNRHPAQAADKAAIPLWQPLPGPQTIAFNHQANVLGYGGAAGGGKTDLAIGLALTKHKKSLLLRRELCNTRAIIDRTREILGDTGSLNSMLGVWRLPDGCSIEFGGCNHVGDEKKYRGRPHDLIVFDEADQFPKFMCDFISGWLRTTEPGLHCQELYCFNPPSSADGEWLISFFGPWIDKAHPRPAKIGEMRWYAMVDGKEVERENGDPFYYDQDGKRELIIPRSRTFIPAKLEDNEFLSRTPYGSKLQSLPEPLRSQLLHGDFDIGRIDDAWQVIPTAWVRAAQARWTPTPTQEKCNCIGVDVAYGGIDQTVIIRRHGNWFSMPRKFKGPATDKGSKAAYRIMEEWRDEKGEDRGCPVNVDAIGWGAACHEALEQLIGRKAVAINVAEGTEEFDQSRKFRLLNVRTAMLWRLREALDPEHGDDLQLPPDPELLADLTAPRFEVRAAGIVVESKEEIKERIGRSPDVGDACCLALWRPRKFKFDVYLG